MLQITIPGGTIFNERTNKFKTVEGQTIELEHSLISISKWESKWKKPFLSQKPKAGDAMTDYIRCMTITPRVDPDLYFCLSAQNLEDIQKYMDDSYSATVFRGENDKSKGTTPKPQTSEKIYARMINLGIPLECQKWHLNRLLTLIHMCELTQNGQKMSRKDSAKYAAQLNAMRKAKYHTRG